MLMMYFMAPKESIKRAMTAIGTAGDQIQELTEKLFDKQAKPIAALRKKYAKPIIGFSFHNRQNPLLQKLQTNAIPVLPSPDRAARAMKALADYAVLREEISKNDLQT
jgi:acyl-CoA synthetase (NDP forming)